MPSIAENEQRERLSSFLSVSAKIASLVPAARELAHNCTHDTLFIKEFL